VIFFPFQVANNIVFANVNANCAKSDGDDFALLVYNYYIFMVFVMLLQ